ncbi:MAG: peptidase M14, partial [Acidobacteria bacterium]|nr:peptidase M14 [Acidobacteriota bacterium]
MLFTAFRFLIALPALVTFASLLAAPLTPISRAIQTESQPVIARVSIKNSDDLHRFVTLGLDLLEMREGDDLFILTTYEQIDRLRNDGWQIRVDEEMTMPLEQLRSEAARAELFLDGYRTVAEMRQQLEETVARNSNLAEFFIFGQSWEKLNSGGQGGHDLFGIRLTNKSKAGPKPAFLLLAAIHARELATSEVAMRLVDYLVNNYGVDGDVTMLLDEYLIVVVPVVNPDGRVIAEQGFLQRKNTNNSYGPGCADPPTAVNQLGIDLNRNHSFQWGVVNTPAEPVCGQTYPGPAAASEPETRAIQDLFLSLFPDQRGPFDSDPVPRNATGIMITLHSYSDLVLWPWGTTVVKAPNAAELEMIGKKFASYNGYTPQQSIDLYPTSGTTDDWSYGELGIASFTFEIGPISGP